MTVFVWKTRRSQNGLLIFVNEKTHSEKSLTSLRISSKKSYNNGKSCKSSRILNVKSKNWEIFRDFACFECFFSFFFIFSFCSSFAFFFFSIFFFYFLFSLIFFSFFFNFFFFFFFHLLFLFLFFIFKLPSRRQNQKKNRRTVPIVKRTISFCENSICGSRWTRRCLGKTYLRTILLSCFSFFHYFHFSCFIFFDFFIFHSFLFLSFFLLFFLHIFHLFFVQFLHFCFFLKNDSSFSFFFVFLSDMYHYWHWYQSLTIHVFSKVDASWRYDVLTTLDGRAGIGLERVCSTLQSGMETSRVLKKESLQIVLFMLLLLLLVLSLLQTLLSLFFFND